MVHVVEDELIRSNALRAYLVGYLLGISHEAIGRLKDERAALDLGERLKELYPLIEKEFYSGVLNFKPPAQPSSHTPDHPGDESVKG